MYYFLSAIVDLAEMHDRSDEFRIKAFGENLQRIREAKNISLRELAHRVDMSHQAIHNIEKGLADPQMTTIAKIAEALDIHPGDLFAFDR